MMSNTQKRQDFFHNICTALGRTEIPEHVTPLDLSAGPQHKIMAGLSNAELVEAFKTECNNLAIKFRETEKEDLADTLMAVIREYGGGKIIYPKVKEITDFHIDRVFEENQGKELPLTHIAVLRRSTIMPRMTQTMAALAGRYHEDPENFPSLLVHISGPSSTVDIELVRVVGVHGPINVTYIILND